MSTHPKITIITVNYNVSHHINKLTLSLNKIKGYIKEIIIIDNNSKDVDQIKIKNNIKLIRNKSNLGFSKAVNQGIRLSKTNLIFLLNPDCYLTNNSVEHSIKLISEDSKIAAIGGKLVNPKSKKYHYTANSKINFLTGLFEFTILKRLFPNNKYSKKFWIESSKNILKPISVESLCGAFIITKKKLNGKLNLFNEEYFLYLEDVDFGNKLNNLGYKVVFDPKSEITHIGGESSGSKYKIVHKHWYKSREIYFKNHLNYLEFVILNIIFKTEMLFLKIISTFTHD